MVDISPIIKIITSNMNELNDKIERDTKINRKTRSNYMISIGDTLDSKPQTG